MEIKAIRTEADYIAALREVSALIDLDPEIDSPEGERLDILGTLVQAYEAKQYPIDPPDPIDAIKFRMEQSGMTVKDLVPYIGPLNRVYEVLAHKRALSLNMIRRLSEGLRIPAEVLIRESEPVAA
ncbi:MAG: transcriptional regulator [Betaproteobacteria bacterium]|jgi:HTH-type transcriptional regulator/antitoxin HigA|nr:transcriptional regulator [Betaproteobacteria bacterium]MBK7654022.1 transcriptional regulator [Betaproteobacteria bacterium]MBP6644942.1 transcriptional regulator [Burkholderiaceae bacterium]